MNRTFSGSEARAMLARARTASLGTLDFESGGPYVSVINVATDAGGLPVILISRLARHTQNLEKDARGSILIGELPAEGDALTGPRVTILGVFETIKDADVHQRYLARHPESAMYVDFADFSFWRLRPSLVHAVAGFGRIETLPPEEVFRSKPPLPPRLSHQDPGA
jgi:putative heme iron utilization protein